MSSSLDNLFNDYNQCTTKYQSQFDYYHSMLNIILADWHSQKQGGMSASVALYQFQLLCMPMVTEMNETNIKQEADALDIASALRQDITNAQSDYNNILGIIQQNRSAASGQMAAQALAQAMNKLQQDLHYPGMTKIMGGTLGGGASAIANIQDFINDIKGQFFGQGIQKYTRAVNNSPAYTLCELARINSPNQWPPTPYTFITGYQRAEAFINGPCGGGYLFPETYYHAGTSYPHIYSNLKSIMKITGGSNNTILQSVTSDFTSMNQSVSGISSQIQASMNYLNQSLQQYYSIYKSIFDSFSNYMNYIIQKSGG